MEIKAQHKNARMSARKLRLIRPLVKGLAVADAEAQLMFRPSRAAGIVLEVMKSAIANAQHNYEVAADTLRVADVVVDDSFKIKRFRAGSKGTAMPIIKHAAHVTVIVEEIGAGKTKAKKTRRTQIETISAAEFARTPHEHEHKHEEHEKETEGKPESQSASHSKQQEAFQKVKMMQQGGDAKKSHRRKSLGD